MFDPKALLDQVLGGEVGKERDEDGEDAPAGGEELRGPEVMRLGRLVAVQRAVEVHGRGRAEGVSSPAFDCIVAAKKAAMSRPITPWGR